MNLKEILFDNYFIKVFICIIIFFRGLILFLFGNTYKAYCDICWLYRVSDIKVFKTIALFFIKRLIKQIDTRGENLLLSAFINSKYALASKRDYSLSGQGKLDIFRDVIVLKQSRQNEKGVLLIKYTPTFDAFLAFFDLNKIMNDYYIVLEPSWAGYCDISILMLISSKHRVIVQCFTKEDYDFIKNFNTNLQPVELGPADWIDCDLFVHKASPEKIYDLIMVANWGLHKRHSELFKALRKIKNRGLKVLLLGFPWDGRTIENIQQEANQINNDLIKIEILENLSSKEVADYLCKSKVFIFLSKKEGDNKALVEAFFCNVPAIVYKNTVGGAKLRINESTGIFSSYEDLDKNIIFMIDNYKKFSPQEYVLEHTGSNIATSKLNDFIKGVAEKNNEPYLTGIVEKTNSPNLTYKNISCQITFKDDYLIIKSCLRGQAV